MRTCFRFGWLGRHPGWGGRASRDHAGRERTEFTLWVHYAVAADSRCDLTKLDGYTARSSPTRRYFSSISRRRSAAPSISRAFLPVLKTHASGGPLSTPRAQRGYAEYFAFFNLDNNPVTLRANLERAWSGR